MTLRIRLAALAGVVVLALVAAGFYVLRVQRDQASAAGSAPAVPVTDLAAALTAPHIVFRSTALGSGYGKLAVAPLTAPDGPRAFTEASCERAYAVAGRSVCLSARRGLTNTYKAHVLGPDWAATGDLPLTGLPSRVRLSRDGALAVTTTFVYGDSYASLGQFSTRTVVTRIGHKGSSDLETFRLLVDGKRITAADRNFWGVTFADDDRFYATAASGGKTWLVRGSLAQKRLDSIRTDVECPSLSPDGTRIAFKKHGGMAPGHWRLAVYDLRTGVETELAETRSVDDQAEWLDDKTVLYGLPRDGATGAATSDIWATPADGAGPPRVLVPDAWSPAVVRTSSPR
ncbi:hypothetical protein M1L60_14285 [Actinoplanes sp. TRM 88003]|uniref:Uncharacterized protein n=1 Tax=Paractinoplanes aksuensis TaxID=2939490 RepID=A0ABT1DLP9_9ACTN|nr:hypothetical protein [Actinoplanes aksuensis]MCO8271762.1 hypothetical protein [Actinoplanes aksuensis]